MIFTQIIIRSVPQLIEFGLFILISNTINPIKCLAKNVCKEYAWMMYGICLVTNAGIMPGVGLEGMHNIFQIPSIMFDNLKKKIWKDPKLYRRAWN